jgi:hypothetical protein
VREDDEPVGDEPPWLLDRAEVLALAEGLQVTAFDRVPHPTRPEGRDRWRMVLTPPAPRSDPHPRSGR